MSNYPEGISATINDPRSPLYIEAPECEECNSYLEVHEDADEDGAYKYTLCPECG